MRIVMSRWPLIAAGLLSLIGLSACSEPQKVEAPVVQVPPAPPSLYDRVGGRPALAAVVDDFVVNVAKDKRISRMLKKSNVTAMKMALVDQLCQGAGGPCQYTPKPVANASKPPAVSDAAAAALVQDMQLSLNKFKVPEREQAELLAIFDPIKGDVLQAPVMHAPMKHAPAHHAAAHHPAAANAAPAAKK